MTATLSSRLLESKALVFGYLRRNRPTTIFLIASIFRADPSVHYEFVNDWRTEANEGAVTSSTAIPFGPSDRTQQTAKEPTAEGSTTRGDQSILGLETGLDALTIAENSGDQLTRSTQKAEAETQP